MLLEVLSLKWLLWVVVPPQATATSLIAEVVIPKLFPEPFFLVWVVIGRVNGATCGRTSMMAGIIVTDGKRWDKGASAAISVHMGGISKGVAEWGGSVPVGGDVTTMDGCAACDCIPLSSITSTGFAATNLAGVVGDARSVPTYCAAGKNGTATAGSGANTVTGNFYSSTSSSISACAIVHLPVDLNLKVPAGGCKVWSDGVNLK